jgi:hypothetical protein
MSAHDRPGDAAALSAIASEAQNKTMRAISHRIAARVGVATHEL